MEHATEERRATPRSRALRAATITFQQGRFSAPCMVRNMSPAGLLLRFDPGVMLPPDFNLLVEGDAEPRRVELRWRRGAAAGVVFVTAEAARSQSQAFVAGLQIEDLRAENAALRKQEAMLMRRLAALGYVAAEEF